MKVKIEKVMIIDVPVKDEKLALRYAKEWAKTRCGKNEFVVKVSPIKERG